VASRESRPPGAARSRVRPHAWAETTPRTAPRPRPRAVHRRGVDRGDLPRDSYRRV